jgi:Sulfotransferase family
VSNLSKKEQVILVSTLTSHLLPLYKKEFPIIFFWSPRSGCTTLIRWFFFQNGLLQKATQYNPWVHSYRMEVFEKENHYRGAVVEQLLAGKKDTYKLVRNPYRRAVSSFLASIDNEKIMQEIAPNRTNLLSFKEFLYLIKNIGVTKDRINSHIAQQYDEREEQLIKNYVRLENFTSEMKTIENKYRLLDSPILSISNSSHHLSGKMVEKGAFADIKMSLKPYGKTLPTYESFYDQETKDLVRELFKKDFEKYGYNQSNITV